MELINVNKSTDVVEPKVDNTKTADKVDAPVESTNASVDQAKPVLAVSESVKAVAPAPAPVASTRRHVVMYLACGIWKDRTGQYWCRDTKSNCIQSKTFTDSEFDARDDIKFMVEYGAMKDTISE